MNPAGRVVSLRRAALIVWYCVGLWLSSQIAKTQEPIPTGPDAYTQRKFRADVAKAREHEIQLYLKHTKDPKEVQAEAVEFLRSVYREWLPVHTREWPEVAAVGKEATGRKVTKHGSHDPLVETCLGWAVMITSRNAPGESARAGADEANQLLVSALKGFKEHGYPDSAGFCTVKFLAELAVAAHDAEALDRYRQLGIELGAALAGDKSIPAGDQRVVAFDLNGFFMSLGLADRKAFLDACGKQPGVDPWTFDLMRGIFFKELAWYHRGGGWASSVSPEKAKLFDESLKVAAKHLVSAWEKRRKFPEPARYMIGVAMAGASELTPRDWFDRAVAAQIDYVPAYLDLINALQPRWGGSHAAMYAFGRECLATKRFDTAVPLMLFNVVGAIDDDLGGRREVWKRSKVYADGKACLDGVLSEPSMADGNECEEPHSRQMSRYVAMAVHADEYGDARKMLDKVGDRIHRDMLARYGLKMPYDTARVFALTGDVAETVKTAEEMLRGEKRVDPDTSKKALALLKTVAKQNTDKRANPYFDFHIASLQMQEDFRGGDWVNLTFDNDLTGWRSTGGRWEPKGVRDVVGHCPLGARAFALVRQVSFPLPYEVEVEMSWDAPAPPLFYTGLLVGTFLQGTNTPGNGRLFGFHPGASWYVVTSAGGGPTYRGRLRPPSNPVKLRVKVWEHHYAFYVNGDLKVNQSDADFDPGSEIGLGPALAAGKHGDVTFSKLRVRKLEEKPDTDNLLGER
jgi:hypothetical protein